jgi:hypothetical protein
MDEGSRMIVVTGEGVDLATADRCAIACSVHAFGKTAAEALSSVAGTVATVLAKLREANVPEADVRTQNISLQDWLDEPSRGRRPVARVATYSLSIVNRTIEEAGVLIGTLTDAAGDLLRVHGIHLSVADSAASRAAARRNAVADARARAEALADAAGVSLGAVLSVQEGSAPVGVAFMAAGGARRMSYGGPPMPIEPGVEGQSVRVTMMFEIGDPA